MENVNGQHSLRLAAPAEVPQGQALDLQSAAVAQRLKEHDHTGQVPAESHGEPLKLLTH